MNVRLLMAVALVLSLKAPLRSEERQVTSILDPVYIAVDRSTPDKPGVAWSRCFGYFQTTDKKVHLAAVKPTGPQRCPESTSVKFEIDRSKGYIILTADGGETITETGQGPRDGLQSRGEFNGKTWKFAAIPNRILIKSPAEKPEDPLVELDRIYLARMEAIGSGDQMTIACTECKSVRAALDSRIESHPVVNLKPGSENVTKPSVDFKPSTETTSTQPPATTEVAVRGKEEQALERAAVNFVTSLRNKRFNDAIKLARAPWLDSVENKVVTENDDVKQLLLQRFAELSVERIGTELAELQSYQKVRPELVKLDRLDIDRRESYQALIESLDRVLGDNGWIAKLQSKSRNSHRVILLRIQNDKIEVCGGPFGISYLNSGNRIPSDIRKALFLADKFEIYSLDPSAKQKPGANSFHGYKVLGTTVNQKPDSRKRLVQALQQGIDENSGEVAACFNPRHGVRATLNGKTIDLLICFECYSTRVYSDEAQVSTFIHTETPQQSFDDILRTAGIETSRRPKN